MKGSPTSFWGKLHPRGETGASLTWHPLAHHCADVAACCEVLLRETTLGRRLADFAGQSVLLIEQVERLCVLAAFHDLGKFNVGFQHKALAGSRHTGDGLGPCKFNVGFQHKALGVPPSAGHVTEIACLFGNSGAEAARRLAEVLPVAELSSWGDGDVACELLIAAISHHGKPVDVDGALPDRRIWLAEPSGEGPALDPFAGIAALVAQTRRWYPAAYREGGQPLPAESSFQHFFAGLVMLSDWLGSDTRFFPFSESLDDRMPFARAQAELATREIGLAPSVARSQIRRHPLSFERSFGFARPRDIQARVAALPVGPGPSLAILEAETGSGKTEAALFHYLRLFECGEVDGVYFALPTRTAATQLYNRVTRVVRNSFPEQDGRPPVVLAVPGYLSVDGARGVPLPDFKVLWQDDPTERLRYRGWAAEAPKRYLAGSVVVGTIDQVLLSTLRVSHAHLRATALSRLLLVVDEVHASDAYMVALLEGVLDFHRLGRGHAMLMSATLGQVAAHRYKRKLVPNATLARFSAASEAPFPSVTWVRDSRLDVLRARDAGLAKSVALEMQSVAGEPQAVAQLATRSAEQGASVLVIRNTVTDCRATQLALENLGLAAQRLAFRCSGKMTAHHSRFALEDRQRLDDEIEKSFGKARDVAGRVAVATQTVQQSLDLDADLLITDLCPMDILLQRVGRLHRHQRTRPRGFETARVIVVTPVERDLSSRILSDGSPWGDLGLGTVYDDLRILEATWRQLEARSSWDIPRDNRALVEATTHPEALDRLAVAEGASMKKHAEWILGQVLACRQIANGHVVDREHRFGQPEVCFPSRDVAGRIATRLGEEDRRVIFGQSMAGIFGTRVRELTLAHHLLRNAAPDAEPEKVKVSPTGFEFRFGAGSYRYDRLGLHPRED